MLKTCSECGKEKELHQFYTKQRKSKYPNSLAGVSSDCRDCLRIGRQAYVRKNPDKVRNSDLKNKYGIDLNQYKEMFEVQKHCCAVCKRHQSQFERIFAVDHNHDTGQVRGLLCAGCNIALGMLEENVNAIESLKNYINHYSELAASNTNVVSISPKKVG